MTNNRAINAVATVITVAAGCWLFLFLNPHPPAIDRRPHEAVGELLAAEAAKLLEPDARLIVIARDPEPFRVPGSIAQLDGFLKALKKSGQSVAGFRWLKLDPLRPNAVPPGDFFDLLRRGQGNDVIVSFLGPPVLDAQQVAKLGNKRLPVLAVCSGAMPAQGDLKRLFDQKLLAVAVISRNDAPAHAASNKERSAFDQMFKLITATNVQELLETTASRE